MANIEPERPQDRDRLQQAKRIAEALFWLGLAMLSAYAYVWIAGWLNGRFVY